MTLIVGSKSRGRRDRDVIWADAKLHRFLCVACVHDACTWLILSMFITASKKLYPVSASVSYRVDPLCDIRSILPLPRSLLTEQLAGCCVWTFVRRKNSKLDVSFEKNDDGLVRNRCSPRSVSFADDADHRFTTLSR